MTKPLAQGAGVICFAAMLLRVPLMQAQGRGIAAQITQDAFFRYVGIG